METDPRTPVLVGAGQVNVRDGDAPEPVELIATAARRAADDAGAAGLLRHLDSVRVVNILSRGYPDPGALVAARLGARPRQTVSTTAGGNMPQVLVDHTAAAIARGELDVALVGGAESWRTREAYRKRGEPSPWSRQPDDVRPTETIGTELAFG
ncbi:MAG: acetyl-CoA acetyltransferase, partial [Actinomycetes bacterium]